MRRQRERNRMKLGDSQKISAAFLGMTKQAGINAVGPDNATSKTVTGDNGTGMNKLDVDNLLDDLTSTSAPSKKPRIIRAKPKAKTRRAPKRQVRGSLFATPQSAPLDDDMPDMDMPDPDDGTEPAPQAAAETAAEEASKRKKLDRKARMFRASRSKALGATAATQAALSSASSNQQASANNNRGSATSQGDRPSFDSQTQDGWWSIGNNSNWS